jgi:3-phytase
MATQSDGSETTSFNLNETFKHGLFVVMSDDKTFHYYRWEDIAGADLKKK